MTLWVGKTHDVLIKGQTGKSYAIGAVPFQAEFSCKG